MVDRKFWVADSRQPDFEAVFGSGGPWKRMLDKADDYLLTRCWCESPQERRYRVRDLWSWHRDFELFRERFHAHVERFEDWLRSERLIEKEQFLGAYYEKFDDGSEEGFVLS